MSIQPISAKDTHKPSFPSQNPYFLLMLVQGVSFTLFFNFLIFLQVEQCCAGISASNVMAIGNRFFKENIISILNFFSKRLL